MNTNIKQKLQASKHFIFGALTTTLVVGSIGYAATNLTETDPDAMKLTENQQIDGVKTFSLAPHTSMTLPADLNDSTIVTAEWHKADVDAKIAALESRLGGRIDTIENKVTTLEGKMATEEAKVSALEAKVTTLTGDVSGIKGEIKTVKGKIDTINNKINTINGKITSMEGNIDDIESEVNTVKGQITTVKSDVATLKTKVATLEKNPIHNTENAKPTVVDDSYTMLKNKYKILNVLSNDSDSDHDVLKITNITNTTNGTWTIE